MLHTDKQTNKQTDKQINAGKNIYLLAEVNNKQKFYCHINSMQDKLTQKSFYTYKYDVKSDKTGVCKCTNIM